MPNFCPRASSPERNRSKNRRVAWPRQLTVVRVLLRECQPRRWHRANGRNPTTASMVRKGSAVRVRKRALENACKSWFISSRVFAVVTGCSGMEHILELSDFGARRIRAISSFFAVETSRAARAGQPSSGRASSPSTGRCSRFRELPISRPPGFINRCSIH